jgi:hypothetical protein
VYMLTLLTILILLIYCSRAEGSLAVWISVSFLRFSC